MRALKGEFFRIRMYRINSGEASQAGLRDDQYRMPYGKVIDMRDEVAVRVELERLFDWNCRWRKLASNTERMRRMGGLQIQQDYMMARAIYAEAIRGLLLRKLWALQELDAISRSLEKKKSGHVA